MKSWPVALWLVLAVALGLRLTGAATAHLMYDEGAHQACAQTLDLRPDSFHLIWRSVDHPFLSVWVVRLSGVLFGATDFGFRVLHAIAGTLGVLAVFLLGRRVFSERAGLWAAALLAVDWFHMTWSYFSVPEVLMLGFATGALIQFLEVLERPTIRAYLWLGLWLGLSHLGKETALLMWPTLWLYLLVSREHRRKLLAPGWYLAHLVFVAVIAVDVWANLAEFEEGYVSRDSEFLAPELRISPRALGLFLGGLFDLVTQDDYWINYENQSPLTCHWVAGLLYFVATVRAARLWSDARVRLMLVTFGSIFGVFTLLPSPVESTYWWSSMTVLPAVTLAGGALAELSGRWRGGRFAVLALWATLAVFAGRAALRSETLGVPRQTAAEYVDTALRDAQKNYRAGNVNGAKLMRALRIYGPHARLYARLAEGRMRLRDYESARRLIERSLEVDPEDRLALRVRDQLDSVGH